MSTIDRSIFFNEIRKRPFGGSMTQQQVEGCSAILDYWEERHAGGDDRWIAYLLGTAYHETAHRMQAIHEFGSAAYFNDRYGPQTHVGQVLGNTQEGDGNRFHGRGFVQLTGRNNYTDWGNRLGIDLVGNPDLALDPAIATRILVEGAILGTFTGVKLADFFNATRDDWRAARQVINGMDRAGPIADLGKQFWAAISHEPGGQEGQARFRPVLRKGAKGEDVRFLQRFVGVVADGAFGRHTEDVVEAFQAANGLVADGIVGRMTWEKLLASGQEIRETPSEEDASDEAGERPLLRFNSRGESVRELQRLLDIAVDGHFGPDTQDAVKRFQLGHGLQDDGIVGPRTWAALLE